MVVLESSRFKSRFYIIPYWVGVKAARLESRTWQVRPPLWLSCIKETHCWVNLDNFIDIDGMSHFTLQSDPCSKTTHKIRLQTLTQCCFNAGPASQTVNQH